MGHGEGFVCLSLHCLIIDLSPGITRTPHRNSPVQNTHAYLFSYSLLDRADEEEEEETYEEVCACVCGAFAS